MMLASTAKIRTTVNIQRPHLKQASVHLKRIQEKIEEAVKAKKFTTLVIIPPGLDSTLMELLEALGYEVDITCQTLTIRWHG